MLSFKRLLYIVLIVAILGGIFLIYGTNESRPASAPVQSSLVTEREFTETRQIDEGKKTRVWILGDPKDVRCGEIYDHVRQFCEDLHLTVAEEENWNTDAVRERDLVIVCDASVSQSADQEDLERFISEGGRVILAAGLGEDSGNACLLPMLGIRKKSAGEDYHDLVFENPLLPVQPEQAYYDGNSNSARITVSADASVYIRDAKSQVPVLYTYDWKKGSVCLINGTFLADCRCMGLLAGAIGALLPDFIYPVLGVKAVFLDNCSIATPEDDELCRQAYGYSTEGFVRDVMWPAFQGISLRTDTPYTSGILAAASSKESLETVDEGLVTAIGNSTLQFGGELAYAANCPKDGKVLFDKEFTGRFSEAFPGYTVRSLVMETDTFSPEMLDVPGADVSSVRGMLKSRDMRLSRENGYTVFPAATEGNSMEDGTLFSICSVLGAYGMVSHVFDVHMMIAGGESAAWDSDQRQLGLFESEVLARAAWLEGRTLSQTGSDVKSYLDLDYGYIKNGSRMELYCSGAVKGQAFFYHTDSRIADAEGLTYQDVGNGYYLLRIQENYGSITLEEGE